MCWDHTDWYIDVIYRAAHKLYLVSQGLNFTSIITACWVAVIRFSGYLHQISWSRAEQRLLHVSGQWSKTSQLSHALTSSRDHYLLQTHDSRDVERVPAWLVTCSFLTHSLSPRPLLATRHLDNHRILFAMRFNNVSIRSPSRTVVLRTMFNCNLFNIFSMFFVLGLVVTAAGSDTTCGAMYPDQCTCISDSHQAVRTVNCSGAGLTAFPTLHPTVRTLWVF